MQGQHGIDAFACNDVIVPFPLVALSLSTLYEGFVWQTVSIMGVVVSLIGNLVIFAPPVKTWRWPLSRAANGTCP